MEPKRKEQELYEEPTPKQIEEYNKDNEKLKSNSKSMKLLIIVVIIFIIMTGVGIGCKYGIYQAKSTACRINNMELANNGMYCTFDDKAVPVIFECNGILRPVCDVKIILTTILDIQKMS